jgi:hypothetical protein
MLSVLSNTKPVLVRPHDAAALVIDTEELGAGAWGRCTYRLLLLLLPLISYISVMHKLEP